MNTTNITNKRVLIIGAGPSGLAQLRAFQSAASKGIPIPQLVCYEKQSNWGGMWNYTWRTGVDEHGEPVHASMYRYLWSNGPKECLEFADYSFDEHFEQPISSFPPRSVLWDYIQGRVQKAGIRKYIRFNTVVRNMQYIDNTKKFTVRAHHFDTNTDTIETFDYVVVATGHFSFPNMPEFPGFETFPGRILHAHDFRDACEFKGKDVLLIGSSYSAEDIGSQCYKYGCKSITTSYRSSPMGYQWPNNWEEKPLLERMEGKIGHFVDGTSKRFDAIILCTGYVHKFPFLPDELTLKTKNRLWVTGLYKGVIWEKNPQLIYLGMQDLWYSFNMFDAQAWFARDYMLGKISLPSYGEMVKESLGWRARELKLKGDRSMFEFQGSYIEHLLGYSDYPKFDIKRVNEAFLQWKQDKRDDIMGFRDRSFSSIMTGTPSLPHKIPWIKAMDDSFEAYFNEVLPPLNSRRENKDCPTNKIISGDRKRSGNSSRMLARAADETRSTTRSSQVPIRMQA